MNIILVVFDSLRKDCVGVYGSPPWGKVHTPHLDAFAAESVVFTRAYPESLPTLPARRALYTGRRVYPFHDADFRLKGDFVGAPGWGPIPEEEPTLAELLREAGYRTGLVADLYHMFKPSKNYWRGFDQWLFLRGQETDPARSGPALSQEELDYWLPREMQTGWAIGFIQQCIMNIRDRTLEQDYFGPRVLREAATWLEQNHDAEKLFLTVESFDPHEPWLVPKHYQEMYGQAEGPEQVKSCYTELSELDRKLLARTRANYSGEVTMCDRWFGHFMETVRVLGLLENSLIVVLADHGHSIGDRDYMGKRGYPSMPEVYDVPLMVRFPGGRHAGTRVDDFVQHTDLTASLLLAGGLEVPADIHGKPFFGTEPVPPSNLRDHVTVAWGSTPTVITRQWWLNCKVDGTGVLLYDLSAADPFARNVAADHPSVVDKLFGLAKADAEGGFPAWLVDLARSQSDAPGCSDLAART